MNTVLNFPSLTEDDTDRSWWRLEAEPVRAVLDLAWMQGDAGVHVHNRIVTLLAPSHVDAVRGIAHDLYLAESLGNGDLDREYGGEARAEAEAEALRSQALTNAQLVASLVLAGVR